MTKVGDLGRRIAERRRSEGLSVREVASRAAMSPAYLKSLELGEAAHLTPSALRRLAAALNTTTAALQGSGMLAPLGPGRPSSGPYEIQLIDEPGCQALVADGGVGRVVVSSPKGPVALPVNFRIVDQDVVFRTAPSSLAACAAGSCCSFEVDRIDDALSEGWSVFIFGDARIVTEPEELNHLQALPIEPWAAGDRDLYVRISPTETTGRIIRRGS